jgi:hypothetical protein
MGASATNYFGVGGTVNGATLAEAETTMPAGGTLSNFEGRTAAALSSGSVTFKVFKNGVETTVTCAIPSGQRTCTDSTHSVTFTAGDTLAVEVTTAAIGTGNQRQPRWSAKYA